MVNPLTNPAGDPLKITRVGKPIGNINVLKQQQKLQAPKTAQATKIEYEQEKKRYEEKIKSLKSQGKIKNNTYDPVSPSEISALNTLNKAETNLKNAEKAYKQELKYLEQQKQELERAGALKDNTISVKNLEQQRKYDLLKAQEKRVNAAMNKYNTNLSGYQNLISKYESAGLIKDSKFQPIGADDRQELNYLNQSADTMQSLAERYNIQAFGETLPTFEQKNRVRTQPGVIQSAFPTSKRFNPVIDGSEYNLMAPRDAQIDYVSGMYSGIKEDPLLGAINLGIGVAFPIAGKGLGLAARKLPSTLAKNKKVISSVGSGIGTGIGALYGGTVAYRTITSDAPSYEFGKITSQELIPGAIGYGIGTQAIKAGKPISKKIHQIQDTGGLVLNTRVAFNKNLLTDPAIRKTMGIATPSGGIPFSNIGVTKIKQTPIELTGSAFDTKGLFDVAKPLKTKKADPMFGMELFSISSLPRSRSIYAKNPMAEGVFIGDTGNFEFVNVDDFVSLSSVLKPTKAPSSVSAKKRPKTQKTESSKISEVKFSPQYDIADLTSIPFTKRTYDYNEDAVLQQIMPDIYGGDIVFSPTGTGMVKQKAAKDEFTSIDLKADPKSKYAEETSYPKIFDVTSKTNLAQERLFYDIFAPYPKERKSIMSSLPFPALSDEGIAESSLLFAAPLAFAGKTAGRIKPRTSSSKKIKIQVRSTPRNLKRRTLTYPVQSIPMPPKTSIPNLEVPSFFNIDGLEESDFTSFFSVKPSSLQKTSSTQVIAESEELFDIDSEFNSLLQDQSLFSSAMSGLQSKQALKSKSDVLQTSALQFDLASTTMQMQASALQLDLLSSAIQISSAKTKAKKSSKTKLKTKTKKPKIVKPAKPKKKKGKKIPVGKKKDDKSKKSKKEKELNIWDINYNFDPFNLIGK